MYWQDYKIMKSIDETIGTLEKYHGTARVVAGGTDLLVQYKEGDFKEKVTLLDISSVPEILGVKKEGDWICVGAATTMSDLSESKILKNHGRALSMGAKEVGSPQIRNAATVGGNVVNAQPAADTSIPLIALGAEAKIVSPKGEKWILVEDLFRDISQSTVDPFKELVTQFRFRSAGKKANSSIQRLAKRKAFTLPSLMVAVMVELDDTLCFFSNARLAAGPVANTPLRFKEAEEILIGSPVNSSVVVEAARLAKAKAQPRNSIRGGADYRKEMVEVFVKRAVNDCLKLLGVKLDDEAYDQLRR